MKKLLIFFLLVFASFFSYGQEQTLDLLTLRPRASATGINGSLYTNSGNGLPYQFYDGSWRRLALYSDIPTINVAYIENLGFVTGAHFSPGTLLNDYGFTDNSSNWNDAYSWGDHSLAGYSTGAHTTNTDNQNLSNVLGNGNDGGNNEITNLRKIQSDSLVSDGVLFLNPGVVSYVDVNSHRIRNVADPQTPQDAATMGWVMANDQSSEADGSETIINAGSNVTVSGTGTAGSPYIISSAGGGTGDNLGDHTATLDIDANDNDIINVATISAGVYLPDGGNNISLDPIATGHVTVNNAVIKNVASPVDDSDAATKGWVNANDADTVADGSETVVTAGTNVTVSGTGTSGNPYVINSTGSGGIAEVSDLADGSVSDAEFELLDGLTAPILSETDIVDNLVSVSSTAPLSAAQGKTLKDLYDGIDGSETSLSAGTNVTISGSGTSGSPYVINSTDTNTIADGTETIVTAGTNVTVTGDGSVGDPYIVNSSDTSADGSETIVTAGTNVTVTGTGTAGSPYVINSTASGSGNVTGPASSSNNRIALFDGTSGELLKESPIIVTEGSPTQVDFDYSDLTNVRSIATNVSVETSFLTAQDFYAIPTDTEPTEEKGRYYLDDSESRIKVHDGTGFEALAYLSDISGGSGDFLADGSVPMTGDLDLDGNNILNAGSINVKSSSSPFSTGAINPGTLSLVNTIDATNEDILQIIPESNGNRGYSIATSTTNTANAFRRKVTFPNVDSNYEGNVADNTVAEFFGRVSGSEGTDPDNFVTLDQLQSATGGGVTGPENGTDNAVVRFDGTTGEIIQNSGVLLSDNRQMTNLAYVQSDEAFFTELDIGTDGLRHNPTDTEPSGNLEGNTYADDSENRLKYYDGTSWKAFLLEGDETGIPDNDSVTPDKMSDADHGSFTYAGNIASLDNNSVFSTTINDGAVLFSKISSSAIASQLNAESASASNVLMTPLRTKQLVDEVSPFAPKQGTGTVIDLSGYYTYDSSAGSVSSFSTINDAFKGFAEVLINQATEPSVSGASKMPDTADFVANTDMILCIKSIGGNVYYFFVEL